MLDILMYIFGGVYVIIDGCNFWRLWICVGEFMVKWMSLLWCVHVILLYCSSLYLHMQLLLYILVHGHSKFTTLKLTIRWLIWLDWKCVSLQGTTCTSLAWGLFVGKTTSGVAASRVAVGSYSLNSQTNTSIGNMISATRVSCIFHPLL